MFSTLKKSIPAFLATTIFLTLCILAGCRASGDTGQAELHPATDSGEPETMVIITEGIPISAIFQPAQNVQDLVNRSQAIVIGTISAISEPKTVIPYGISAEEFAKKYADIPEELRPTLEVIDYDIAIEEVLLDDGNVRAHPRLSIEPDSTSPQLGKRYLFALGRNPDSLSYGISGFYSRILTMDDNGIRNLDGSSPGYVGVTNEATLVSAIREAAANYDFLPPNQWPTWREDANDGDPPETPEPPPGSPGDGDAGPTGNANN